MPKRVKKPGNSDNQEAVSKKAKTEVKEIDHDKQAAEIIKQQNQAKTQTNEPVNVIRTVVITDSGLVQKRQDSGPSVDPPSQGTTVEKKVASVSDEKTARQLPEVIEDVGRSKQVVDVLAREGVLAVDCEGVSLGVEGPLTLVQVGNYSGEVYLFDILKNKDLLSRGRLGTLLESPNITKVIQSCSNDSAALYHQFKVTLKNVFDTQVANIVIQEHKGRRLAPLLKLAVICEEYGGKKFSTELKDDVQAEWMTMTGDLWAKRPMTDKMILYAAGDVRAIVPEVYENQKRYLEDNNLLEKFEERVQEEIFYFIDPSFKQKRNDRVESIAREIIRDIKAKCSSNTGLADFKEDGDEYRALQRIHFKDAAHESALVGRLKTELIRKELTELSEQLDQNEESSFLNWRSKARLFCYEKHPDRQIADTAKRVLKRMNDIALKTICTKYNMESKLNYLRPIEKETLRSLRPDGIDDPNIPRVALRLYWLLMDEDLQNKIDEFNKKPRCFKMADGYYRKMKFFIARRTRVPGNLKQKAQRFKNDLDRTFGQDVVPSGNPGF